jgi:hypothetical protein
VTTQEDVASGWWHLVARGVQQVLFVRVAYDPTLDSKLSRGFPVCFCG